MKSLHRTLNIWLCGMLALLFLLAGSAVVLLSWHTWLQQFDATLTARASTIIASSEAEDGEVELDPVIADFTQVDGDHAPTFYEMRAADGKVLKRSSNLRTSVLPPLPAPDTSEAYFQAMELPAGLPGRAVIVPFVLEDDDDHLFTGIHLVMAGDLTGLREQRRVLITVLTITGVVAILLTVPLVRWILDRGLKPVERLAKQATTIDAEGLDARFSTASMPEELRPVVARMNDLLSRLQGAFERERRFTSHVAHELRTPLAELRLNTEMLVDWPEEATRERLSTMHDTTLEMQGLVETLLMLSRAQAGQLPVQQECVDATSAVMSVIDQLKSSVEVRNIQTEVKTEEVVLKTDPVLWKAILANLIGNAVRHSPENSNVVIESSAIGLSVTNPAPDLKDEDTARMFDAFWQKDTARSGYGHAGLGLSLVKAYCDLLGYRVHAILQAGFLTISVKWPQATTVRKSVT